jgi:hypothetical protein
MNRYTAFNAFKMIHSWNIMKEDRLKVELLDYMYEVNTDFHPFKVKKPEFHFAVEVYNKKGIIASMIQEWKEIEEYIPEVALGRSYVDYLDILRDHFLLFREGGLFVHKVLNFLVEQNLAEARETLIWGQNYDADNNLLPYCKPCLIKDMNTGHIEAVLKLFGKHEDSVQTLEPIYERAFLEELERRKTKPQ